MNTYQQSDIEAALRSVGLVKGDTVYVISALWRVAGLKGADVNEDVSPAFYQALRNVIGDAGTIVVPTTTHNLCNTDIPFNVATTPSYERGQLTEYVRKLPDAARSFHPFSSYGAVGPKAEFITANVSRNGYGPETPESRMIEIDAKFLALGVGPNIITTTHHLEHVAGVPYRYHKEFMHPVVRDGKIVVEPFYLFVYYRNADIVRSQNRRLFARLDGRLDIRRAKLGRGELSSYSLAQFYELALPEFINDLYIWLDHPPSIRPYQA